MIAHKNWIAPTKDERERMDLIVRMPCPCCAIAGYPFAEKIDCHHLLSGNKRMGHWWTLNLCEGHHAGKFSVRQRQLMRPKYLVAISDGRKLFCAVFPSERQLWERLQKTLGLEANWPASKILPRRCVA